jgi:23S rRNA pseudouridine2604 synthase
MQTRLNKFISETGICSRREADLFIEQGRVIVNGQKVTLGTKVSSADVIKVNGQLLKNKAEAVYLAFHKPVGISCTTDQKDKDNIVAFINYPNRIFPIGRLDKDSEGLIFLTNDGDIVNKILRAGNQHEKEYIVTVNKSITNSFVQKMSRGVSILDTVTRKCFVEKIGQNTFKIILVQGLNRQIRRMCEVLGYKATRLKRTRIMNVTLTDIAPGKWRYLTDTEKKILLQLVTNSTKTKEA